jgi:spore coat polysaccharide biosynthesis protein SpsF
MKYAAIILARMGSTRLSMKVLRPVCGRPMLAHVINRAGKFPEIEPGSVALAIPVGPENDELAEFGGSMGVRVVRGDEDDVLSRFLLAAHELEADVVYRITADNPLLDPGVAEATYRAFSDGVWDYAVMENTPLGTTAEIVTVDALERATKLAVSPRLKEHPTLAFYENSGIFKMRLIQAPPKWAHPEWRFTVDTELDLKLVERILTDLGEDAGLDAIVPWLERNPDIARMNESVAQSGWGDLKEMKNAIGTS